MEAGGFGEIDDNENQYTAYGQGMSVPDKLCHRANHMMIILMHLDMRCTIFAKMTDSIIFGSKKKILSNMTIYSVGLA